MLSQIHRVVNISLALICFLFVGSFALQAEVVVGTLGHVRDGDTFAVCDATKCTNIRLCGIDSPERNNAASAAATAALKAILRGQKIHCKIVGSGTVCDGRSQKTNRDRYVAQCAVNGVDVAGKLVDAGHACDWLKFSNGHYSRGKSVCKK